MKGKETGTKQNEATNETNKGKQAQTEYEPVKHTKVKSNSTHADDMLDELDDEAGQYTGSAYARNSKNTASTALRAFIMFMIAVGCVHETMENGITDKMLGRYLAMLARTLKYKSIKTYISMGVRLFHLQNGIPWVATKDRWPISQILRGIRRKKGDETEQKQPISPRMLLAMKDYLAIRTKQGMCVWAAMLVAFLLMLRKSNIMTDKPDNTNDRAPIKMGDLKLVSDEGLWIRLRHTKTIQYTERELWLLLPRLHNSDLCPTMAIFNHIKANRQGAGPNEPLFATQKGPLKYNTLLNQIKQALKKCGYNPQKYAGHSLRRGGATWAFSTCKMAGELIKTIGDWTSQAYLLYATVTDEMKRQSAAKMAEAIAASNLGEHQPTSKAGKTGGIDLWSEE